MGKFSRIITKPTTSQLHITFGTQFTTASCGYITFVKQSVPLIRPFNTIQLELRGHTSEVSKTVQC